MAKFKKTYTAPQADLTDLVLPEAEVLPEPEEAPVEEAPVYTCSFFCVNPYSLLRFGPGMRTPVEEIDSWTASQIEAKILRLC